MAAPPFPDFGAAPPKKGPSIVIQAGLLAGLTVMALGMGWVGGGQIKPLPGGETAAEHAAPAAPAHGKAAPAKGGHGDGGHDEETAPEHVPGQPVIVPLAPITTNLAAPADIWLRLELALQFADVPEPGMAETVTTDLLAYLRTVKLHQINGPSGLIHLKADLDERAKIRSEGKVMQVFLRTMIFE